jgi:hypothetical protein
VLFVPVEDALFLGESSIELDVVHGARGNADTFNVVTPFVDNREKLRAFASEHSDCTPQQHVSSQP